MFVRPLLPFIDSIIDEAQKQTLFSGVECNMDFLKFQPWLWLRPDTVLPFLLEALVGHFLNCLSSLQLTTISCDFARLQSLTLKTVNAPNCKISPHLCQNFSTSGGGGGWKNTLEFWENLVTLVKNLPKDQCDWYMNVSLFLEKICTCMDPLSNSQLHASTQTKAEYPFLKSSAIHPTLSAHPSPSPLLHTHTLSYYLPIWVIKCKLEKKWNRRC